MSWEVDTAVEQAAERHRQCGEGCRRPDPRHRPGSRGRSDFLARARRAEAEARARRTSRSAASSSTPSPSSRCSTRWPIRARSTCRWSMPISPAARSTISSASRCRRCSGASCRAPARPAACSRSRCGWSATARPRSSASCARNTGRSRRSLKTPRNDGVRGAPHRLRRRRSCRSSTFQQGADADDIKSHAGRRDLPRRLGRGEADQAQSRPALHHLDPAAGGLVPARLLGLAHHADRAAALRRRRHRRRDRRSDHLYAYRRRADGARGDRRGARAPSRNEFGQTISAGEAALLLDQGEERPGSARGDPPDRFLAHAGIGAPISRCRSGAALRPDLEARHRQPDAAGRDRAHHRRDRRRQRQRARPACAPSARSSASTASSPPIPTRRKTTTEEDDENSRLPEIRAGETLAKRQDQSRPSTSPSRRRAIRKRR